MTTNLQVVITDYRDTDGTLGVTLGGITPDQLGEEAGLWLGSNATLAVSPEEGLATIIVGSDSAEIQAVFSIEQFNIALLALTGDVEAVEEMVS